MPDPATPPRRPRALFLASQPYFQWRGSPIRLGFDVRALAENGYDVDFLTLPIGEDRPVEGVRILRCPNLFRAKKIAIGPSPLKLAFDAVMFVEALGMICRRHYDVVHGVEDCGLPAWILSRLARAKAVFEKHSDAGSYKKGLVIRAYRAVERFVMRHADAVIGTGPGLVRQVEELGGGTPAFCVSDIPSSLVEPDPDGTAAARAELEKAPGEVLATYVGSFAVYQGIELLFRSMPVALAKAPNLRFVVIGGTPEEIARWTAWLRERGCADRVSFIGKRPPDRLPCYLAASDLLLSPRIQGLNTPLKLLDYLKVARGIVATDHPANRLILDETTALFAAPEPEAFGAAVAALAADPARRAALAARCRARVDERYNFGVFREGLRAVYAAVLGPAAAPAPLRFGLVADAHAGDLDPQIGRQYRDASRRLGEAARALAARGARFLVELGDLKDAGPDAPATLRFLDGAASALRAFPGPVQPVLGNHDADLLSKDEFLACFARALGLPEPPAPHRAFDVDGVRFVALDCDFRPDGAPYCRGDFDWRRCIVPADQLDWLRETLAAAPGPAVVLVHARLDGDGECTLSNAAEVRAVLERSGKVRAVFQGHHHAGAFSEIAGIGYYTLPALCEKDGPFALATVRPDGRVCVEGVRGAPSLSW